MHIPRRTGFPSRSRESWSPPGGILSRIHALPDMPPRSSYVLEPSSRLTTGAVVASARAQVDLMRDFCATRFSFFRVSESERVAIGVIKDSRVFSIAHSSRHGISRIPRKERVSEFRRAKLGQSLASYLAQDAVPSERKVNA